jgi:hypothetical protein
VPQAPEAQKPADGEDHAGQQQDDLEALQK